MEKSDFDRLGICSSNNVDDLRSGVLIEVFDNDRTLVLSVPVSWIEMPSFISVLLRDSSNDIMIVVKKYGN